MSDVNSLDTPHYTTHRADLAGYATVLWAIFGFLAFMLYAIFKLALISIEALDYDIDALHLFVFLANLAFMGYSEGYRGFQLAFSPRFAARARYLATSRPNLSKSLLAPLFCMCFFDAPKRRLVSIWLLTLMIISFVILFRYIPHPWRGILDAGVVFGLSWGLLATLYCLYQAFSDKHYSVDPELAENSSTEHKTAPH